jgi:ligand-binding SRPBCC domain-containing protein
MTPSDSINLVSNNDGSCELVAVQRVLRPISDVFDFFADAHNLEGLTPASLQFAIVNSRPIEMRAGTTIEYRLRIHGIPTRWRSEIAMWQPPHRFVDVQLRGPYRFWRHEHAFREDADATIVFDHVRYQAPGGRLANRVLVARDLRRIFHYRQVRLPMLLQQPPLAVPTTSDRLGGADR